ncbi:MAG: hypothetical protein ABSF36_01000 [Candidatus Methanomethylicaceae archaeon]|jgi:hypothetical protein
MPQKKRQGPSRKLQIGIIFIAFILVFSYVIVIFSPYLNTRQLPSPSTFTSEEWMSFVPSQTYLFRYLNISVLQDFPLLFQSSVLFSIQDPAMNISISDVTYDVDLETSNGTGVSIMAMNSSSLSNYSFILAGGNLNSSVYDNVTLYRLAQDPFNGSAGAWICVSPKAVILSSGDAPALSALKSVLDTSSNAFFTNDEFKVGYQLTTGGKDYLLFTYSEAGNNSYNVDWEMRSAFNGSTIGVTYIFHFPTTAVLNGNYANLKTLLTTATSTYSIDKFGVFDFSYSQGDIRYAILGG